MLISIQLENIALLQKWPVSDVHGSFAKHDSNIGGEYELIKYYKVSEVENTSADFALPKTRLIPLSGS